MVASFRCPKRRKHHELRFARTLKGQAPLVSSEGASGNSGDGVERPDSAASVPRSGVGKAGNAEVDEAAGKAPASSGVVEGQVSPEKSEALEKPSSSEPDGGDNHIAAIRFRPEPLPAA